MVTPLRRNEALAISFHDLTMHVRKSSVLAVCAAALSDLVSRIEPTQDI